jgi:hypothetical protein
MTKATKKMVQKLTSMKVNELQARFAEVTGETTRSPNKVYLVRCITEALQGTEARAKTTKAKRRKAATPRTEGESLQVETSAPQTEAETTTAAESAPVRGMLSKLGLPELKAKYLEVVGRYSGSSNKAYLVWKIREAQKGRIKVGPRQSVYRAGATFKVLPLRLEPDVVEKLDAAWRRLGLHSRTELIRRALQSFASGAGEQELAALLEIPAASGEA